MKLKRVRLSFALLLGGALSGCTVQNREAPSPQSAPTSQTSPQRSTVANGSENPDFDADAAWFLGDRQIRYCFVLAPNFGLTPTEIAHQLTVAFEQWQTYLLQQKVNDPLLHPERKSPKWFPKLFLNATPLESCDGSEHLKFYFGVTDDAVREALPRFGKPIAFAKRLTYKLKEGWGSGFIWLAEPHRNGENFPEWGIRPFHGVQGALIHELGHVLGCGHVKYTIMEKDYADHLMEHDLYRDIFSERKNLFSLRGPWPRELLLCDKCPVWKEGTAEGNAEILRIPTPHGDFNHSFLSPLPNGDFQFGLSNWEEIDGPFAVTGIRKLRTLPSDEPVFKMIFQNPSTDEVHWITSRTEAVVYSVQVGALDGKSLPATLTRNSSEGRFILDFEGTAKPQSLILDAREDPL